MTYEEFVDGTSITPVFTFLGHDLRRVSMKFETWFDAEYTDEKRAQMSEDEFVEWVAKMFYERVCGTEPFSSAREQ